MSQKQDSLQMPLKEALYVSDWDITKIYGPGTPQQTSIISKLNLKEPKELYNGYVLYRMGADPGDSSEGILMLGFAPKNPQTALQLKQDSVR